MDFSRVPVRVWVGDGVCGCVTVFDTVSGYTLWRLRDVGCPGDTAVVFFLPL